MAIADSLVILPSAILFFSSGLLVNLIQAFCYMAVKPLSNNTYRRINREVSELLWLELVCLVDWWAAAKVELYADDEDFTLMGREHALLMPNHRGDIDWLVGWVLAQRSGCLGSALAVMKKELKYLPVIGWSMWFSEYLFLETNWAKDEITFKGFVATVSSLRSFVPAIYDITVAIPETSPAPTMLGLFRRQSVVVHVHMRRRLMKELPETDEGIAQWCRDAFVVKDMLLDKHKAEGSFSEKLQHTGGPVKALLKLQVVCSWTVLIILGSLKLIQWSSFLSSWKGIAFLTIAFVIMTILMQYMIQVSQSEQIRDQIEAS